MADAESKNAVRKRGRFWIKFGLVALASLILAAVAYPLLGPPPVDDSPVPNPNGYDELIRAAHSIAGPPPGPRGDYQKASADELREWVAANGEALEIARTGVRHDGRVVLPRSAKNIQAQLDKSSQLRQLCRLMGAAARLDQIEGRPAAAAQKALDVIKAGHRGTRGGLLNDTLAGVACEWYGIRVLAQVRNQLKADQCRSLIDALETIDGEREPISKIVARDRAWTASGYSIFARAALALSPTVNNMVNASTASAKSSSDRNAARLRLLIAEFAIECYRQETGIYPPSLEALVPKYLARVPEDPFVGRPLRYRLATPEGYRVFSVGPDGRDDGGKPFPEKSDWTKARGDVLVETK